jgi:hypothetical protein
VGADPAGDLDGRGPDHLLAGRPFPAMSTVTSRL